MGGRRPLREHVAVGYPGRANRCADDPGPTTVLRRAEIGGIQDEDLHPVAEVEQLRCPDLVEPGPVVLVECELGRVLEDDEPWLQVRDPVKRIGEEVVFRARSQLGLASSHPSGSRKRLAGRPADQ
jgi:hypothetical protein